MKVLHIIILTLFLSSCSFFEEKEDKTEAWGAQRLYSEAKDALDSGDFSKAVGLYEKLETRFPFGVYGQQSLLDLAYAYYKNNDHDQAVSSCNRFIKLYPQNRHVDYAYYLRGLVNFERGLSFTDRVLDIDKSQRNQTSSEIAFRDFEELTDKFPESEYSEDARQRMIYLRNILAKHELHVANYYLRRGAYLAAANRARIVVEQYERTPSMPEALALLARSYKVMGMDDLSRDSLRVLQLNYPNYPGIAEVEEIVVR